MDKKQKKVLLIGNGFLSKKISAFLNEKKKFLITIVKRMVIFQLVI